MKERELPEWFYQGALLLSRDNHVPWHVLYYCTDEEGTILSARMRRAEEDKIFPIKHILSSFRPVPDDWEESRPPIEDASDKPRLAVEVKPERYKQLEF